MAFITPDLRKKRENFKKELKSGKLMRFVGSFSPLATRLIEEEGFEGVYISGAVMSSDLALPDRELITLSELMERGGAIAQNSPLPGLVDADTGFGGPLNVARTVQKLEQVGFCGLHLEDQKTPKKCGHLDHKPVVSTKEMQKKIESALKARSDSDFLIAIRTDSREEEGLDSSIKRAKAYIEAGAEALFPEALKTKQEFEKFRDAVSVPLIANMTEFGKSELISMNELEKIGYNIVLYPVTIWRVALKAVKEGLQELNKAGHQKDLISKMFTRKQLYELIKYEEYEKF